MTTRGPRSLTGRLTGAIRHSARRWDRVRSLLDDVTSQLVPLAELQPTPDSVYAWVASGPHPQFLLAGARPRPGWYMFEIAVETDVTGGVATFYFDQGNGSRDGGSMDLPFIRGILSKRLYRVAARPREVRLTLLDTKGRFSITHLRFLRVPAYFAHDRMLRRLGARHYLFRALSPARIRHALEEESWTRRISYGELLGSRYAETFSSLRPRPQIPAEGDSERRPAYERMQQLERRIPGVTEPVAFDRIEQLRQVVYARVPVQSVERADARLVALVPHLDPDILFGGYRAFFELIRCLQRAGVATSFVVCEPTSYPDVATLLDDLKKKAPDIWETVTRFGAPQLASAERRVTIGRKDRLIAYSASTARIANSIVAARGGEPFFFFIQEYEPVFFPHNSLGFVTGEPFFYPNYIPIFNSRILKEYFEHNRIGGDWLRTGSALVFEHAIHHAALDAAALRARCGKKFLLYARPESHAERNLFEIAILALEKAISRGIFAPGWESFTGIGSLGTYATISLPFGNTLELLPKLPSSNYYAALHGYDLGMSLIFAPHPGVVHYEFARAGIPTVTNIYPGRDHAALKAKSRNIIPAHPTLDSLVQALAEGVAMAERIEERIENALQMDAPSNWDQAFADVTTNLLQQLHSQG